ncbi:PilZ domain-containing protein [Myxococcota bacterium]|jgi:c-di-GMP-binding flagellar brake protein YcgR|nr:PilZ domain-containing protein [Myxococcota bacterium]MBU1412759.1 PilZ domain-containing protein [Myxococcota bacterium]MBU1510190.1 PilZ domain-containing protein [Myxococcota bacterium]
MSTRELDNAISFLQKSRRAHKRFAVKLPVVVRSGGNDTAGEIHNLSLGGMFVVFPGQAGLGDQFECLLSLPGVEPSPVPVEVRWFVPRNTDATACGLKFLSMPDRMLKAIVELSSDANLR